MKTITYAFSVALLLTACVAHEGGEGDRQRGSALGKADHVSGSCAAGDFCDGQSDGSCWCDDLCAEYGDCCSDAADVCGVDECDASDDTGCHEGETCVAGPPADCQSADSCAAQDATGVGMCEAFFGYAWNGSDCVGISGCSCEGSDCDDLHQDPDVCVFAHATCEPQPEPDPEPIVCGGIGNLPCPEGQYCAYGDSCGAGDQTGECAMQPDACIQVYDPVCGCDGQTYGNACTAASAGVSVAHAGECAAGGDSCQGQCGGKSEDGSCWCDDWCESYGDCCADKVDVCD